MRVREKQVDYRETENDDSKIKDAQLRRACSPPTGIACQPQIENVSRENEQRDCVFGIVVPDIAREPVSPDEAHRGADGDGDESTRTLLWLMRSRRSRMGGARPRRRRDVRAGGVVLRGR